MSHPEAPLPIPDSAPIRRTRAWGLLALLALASGGYAWRTFPSAFPILELDVRMDRSGALAAADSVAAALALGPPNARQAAVFAGDGEVQTFVELEGGGPEAFRALVREGRFHAWLWEVRRFVVGTPHEVRLFFSPEGSPHGVEERLPEDAPGAALPADSARRLAESAARRDWGVDLAGWTPLPPALEGRPSGRVDHTFRYERADPALGLGRLRLRLEVAGDRLTVVRRDVEVPEAFTRRYREIRSANEGLATAATYAMVVLYGLGGIALGLVFLARRQPLHLRAAFRWSLALALLVTAAAINLLPLAWMGFDTALGTTTFLLQQAGLAIAGLIGMTLLFGASFLGGENLSRAGFGAHPFLWGAFGREAGATRGILHRVALGLLLTPVFLAYAVGFSALSNRWSGWWSPLSPLTEPNLIAMPLPWLAIIAGPAQAALWEELLFRAVPFGLALLLARRFGGRRGWLALAFVVQAVVFAAAHANYPAQPAYARLVELLLPSFLFGALFLRWGLIPAIVLHFEYDLALFALPLFATPLGALAGSKLLVAVAAVAPLGIVVLRRWQAGGWGELVPAHRNMSHQERAAPLGEAPEELPRGLELAGSPPYRLETRWLVTMILAGVAAWSWGQVTRPPSPPPLGVGRAEAEAAGLAALTSHGVGVTEAWTPVSRIEGGVSDAHRFVWDVAGAGTHDSLLGSYLPVPRWTVALRRFEGDVAERAEEWIVPIDAMGRAGPVEHRLPEGREGASLEESAARVVAERALRGILGADPATLEPVAAVPTERPARRDWLFTWADTLGPDLGSGQLRLEVALAGEEVTRAARQVHLPEEWTRERRRTAIPRMLPAFMAGLSLIGLGAVAVIAALARWSRGTLARRRALLVGAAAGVLGLVSAWNAWPAMAASLSTSEPLAIQVPVLTAWAILFALVSAAGLGLMTGLPTGDGASQRPSPWLPGLALGCAVLGLRALIGILRRGDSPRLPTTDALEQALPLLATALSPVEGLLAATAILVAARWALAVGQRGSGFRRGLAWALVLGLALTIGGGTGAESAGVQLLALGGGLAITQWGVRHVVRPLPSAIPVAAATLALFGLVRALGTETWPGSRMGALAGIVLLALTTAWLVRLLQHEDAPPRERDGASSLPEAG